MIIANPAKETPWTLISGFVALAIFAYPILAMPRGTVQESVLFWLCLINLILWSIVVILRAYFFFAKALKSDKGESDFTSTE